MQYKQLFTDASIDVIGKSLCRNNKQWF